MEYNELMFMYLATVIPSFILGTILLFMKKEPLFKKKRGKFTYY